MQNVQTLTPIKRTKIVKKAQKWELEDILMPSLSEFYKESDHMEKFLAIVGRDNPEVETKGVAHDATSPVSRRVLDWFVTGYAYRHQIVYDLNDPIFHNGKESDEIKPFNVHKEYKAQLKSFQKRNFDTFCRRDRIKFYYDVNDESKYKITTVGQLNFFRWAISNKVIDYVLEYLSEIEEDMNLHTKTKPKKASTTTKAATTSFTGTINQKRIHNISASRATSKKETVIRIRFD